MAIANMFDWSEADRVPVTPANVFLLQGVGDEVIFVFGHAPPPVATAYMDAGEKVKYFEVNQVPVSQIVRVSVTSDVAKFVLATLKLNLNGESPNADAVEQRDGPTE